MRCKGLLAVLLDSKASRPFPNHTGVVVWYGDTKIYAFDSIGCPIGEVELSPELQKDIPKALDKFIERLREVGVNVDAVSSWPKAI